MIIKVFKTLAMIVGGWYLGQLIAIAVIEILEWLNLTDSLCKILDIITIQTK
jgi:hypothetical protein